MSNESMVALLKVKCKLGLQLLSMQWLFSPMIYRDLCSPVWIRWITILQTGARWFREATRWSKTERRTQREAIATTELVVFSHTYLSFFCSRITTYDSLIFRPPSLSLVCAVAFGIGTQVHFHVPMFSRSSPVSAAFESSIQNQNAEG